MRQTEEKAKEDFVFCTDAEDSILYALIKLGEVREKELSNAVNKELGLSTEEGA